MQKRFYVGHSTMYCKPPASSQSGYNDDDDDDDDDVMIKKNLRSVTFKCYSLVARVGFILVFCIGCTIATGSLTFETRELPRSL